MKYLKLSGIVAAALLACSCSTSSVAVKETSLVNSNSSSRERHLASSIHQEINRYRATQGLKALKLHSGLTKLAKPHSNYMMTNAGSFSVDSQKSLITHYGFGARSTMANRKYQIESLGENVIASYEMGQGTDLAAKMVRGWLTSPNHKHNIHSKWTRTGIAVSFDARGRAFVTQLFGTEPSQLLKVGGPAQW
ncbi:MAG: CAP domain-containing protein [Roseibacillus sp.]